MFLSYARSSEEQANYAERALRDAGYIVWRDTELPAHLSYADVIEERLKSAKAVLVLWSAEAAKSQWVRAEADAARELGTLIQSSVDGTVPPIPFNQIQCANLKGWSGENDHAGWRKLKASVVALAGAVEEPAKVSKRQRASNSICVLPFQNMSGDVVPDYFSDGISEDITSDLAKVSTLSVTPRKMAFEFKGHEGDACSVAEKLNVGYVLEGSVRRAGDRVRITAQLIDGSTGDHVWSDRYYGDFTDIFSAQDEISKAIVDALKLKLLPVDKKAVEERENASAPKDAKFETPPDAGPLDEAPAALNFAPESEVISEQLVEVQDAPAPAPETNLDEAYVEEEASYAGDEWNAAEETYPNEEWDDGEEWPKRGYRPPQIAPRLIIIGLGVVLLLLAVFAGAKYWPDRPPAIQEENLSYTITSTVNVRSLPMMRSSRILGQLDPGDTINIVPSLAGAQPDWVKIKDGPYVGGYVWRESTRPTSESSDPDEADTATKTARNKTAGGNAH